MSFRGTEPFRRWLMGNQSEKTLPQLVLDLVFPRSKEAGDLVMRLLLLAHGAYLEPERKLSAAILRREVAALRKQIYNRPRTWKVLPFKKYESRAYRKRREAQERHNRAWNARTNPHGAQEAA